MSDMVILDCVRSACRLSEGELRYQLGRRRHPLAQSDRLIVVLAEMEREGLVETELRIAIGENGRVA